MAELIAGATKREAANRRIVALGFAYPDAIDIRTTLPRGNSPAPVRGTASRTSSALPCLTPDPGPANEPTASHPQSQSPEDEPSPVGGTS